MTSDARDSLGRRHRDDGGRLSAHKLIMAAAPVLLALCACSQMDQFNRERDQALSAFVAAQDAARDQLRLFQQEPHGSCGSQHLAQASAGANANLALLDPAHPADPARPLDPSVVPAVTAQYGNRPLGDAASLTLDVANAAADAGCPDQARVLYGYVIDRYVKSDFAGYRQRAELGLAQLGGQ
jgi:hypothetical protein